MWTVPGNEAALLHFFHITAEARGGTAEVVAVAIKKYKKFKLMFTCSGDQQPLREDGQGQ